MKAIFVAVTLALATAGWAQTMRIRPLHTLSPGQKAEYERLAAGYAEVFRIVSRAVDCKHPDARRRMIELAGELERRHGDHPLVSTMVEPPAAVACQVISQQLTKLRLPDVPASLVLGSAESIDHELIRGRVPTGPYRIVRRTYGEGKSERTAVIHNEKVVFESQHHIETVEGIDAPTPVLAIATANPALRCPERARQVSWHAVALPRAGQPRVTPLDADCMDVRIFHRGAGVQRPSACIDLGAPSHSRYFSVDDAGTIAITSEPPPGSCR